MPDDPHSKSTTKPTTERKDYICASLLLLASLLALATTTLSLLKYITWYHKSPDSERTDGMIIYTILLITACAPLCGALGIMVAAIHYWKKKSKYGKYTVKMRRQARGYCIYVSDGVDGKIVGGEKGVNDREPRIAQVGDMDDGHIELVDAKAKRMSFFNNPRGWVMKAVEPKYLNGLWVV